MEGRPWARSLRSLGKAGALRAGEIARRVPVVLVVLLAIAIGLRLAMWIAYRPAVTNFSDSIVYIGMARDELFIDPVRAAGYSILLRALHAGWSDVDVVIAVQHLIGILTGILLYATVMRIGAPRWAALASGAAIWLSLDQVLAEHTPASEPLFVLLIVAALYAGVRALDDPSRLAGVLTTRHAWIVAAGAALGLAAWTRQAAAPLAPFLALWLALAIPGRVWDRLGRALLGGGTAVAVLLVYFFLNDATTGYFGLTPAPGRVLYARTAVFADCTQFDPPGRTESLCEATPYGERPPPDFYLWGGEESPAWMEFGPMPNGDSELREFAIQAITHQPFRYGLTVFNDWVRYFAPGYHLGSPSDPTIPGSLALRDPTTEHDVLGMLNTYYSDESLRINGTLLTILGDLQQILRVHSVLMLQGLILGLVGIGYARGRVRAGLALLVGVGVLLPLVPSATSSWAPRYALPVTGPLVAAGAVGLWVILQRLIASRGGRPDALEASSAPGSAPAA